MEIEVDRLIVTDLTRFSNGIEACTAGYDLSTGKCIRPWPYIKLKECEDLKIEPGAILKGTFTVPRKLSNPHYEDMDRNKLNFLGACTVDEFRAALDLGLVKSIVDGFGYAYESGNRCIPYNHKMDRSLITISVNPLSVRVYEDNRYGGKKIKISFTDSNGKFYNNVPIADLGFFNYAHAAHLSGSLEPINELIHSQDEVLLRIGLTRRWLQPGSDRDGYWIQVNGVYTFPGYSRDIRSY